MKRKYDIYSFSRLIENILKHKFEFIKYPAYNEKVNSQKRIILRHDVDFSLLAAYEIAKRENQLGVKSTFFLYLNSVFYSITYKSDIDVIRNIIALGHDIALHYDSNSTLSLDVELKILKEIFPECRNDIISFHRPSSYPDSFEKFISGLPPGTRTTYDNVYVKNIKYISDSRCILDFGNLNMVLENNESLQLLLHPIWWYFEGETTSQKLSGFYNERCNNILRLIKENLSIKINLKNA